MNINKIKIEIGLEKPLKLLHVSDTHLTFADERENERKRKLAKERKNVFEKTDRTCLEHFEDAINYANKNCDLLVHTGDLIDFVSEKNIEAAQEMLEKTNYFFATGNHEFSQYVGEAVEDEAYKMQSYPRVQKAFKNHLLFDSRLINGLNLVSIDNSYYTFTYKQLDFLKSEIDKGYPVVLMMHNPIHTDDLYHVMMFERKAGSAYSVGTPVELMKDYNERNYNAQQTDQPTRAFLDYLSQQTAVKAILTGHLHFTYETTLPCGIKQYIAGGGFEGCANEIEII